MRSCLVQLILLLALAFVLVWFVLPIGVAALVQGALSSSGFSGTNTQVQVASNPPFMLLTGRADSIHITSTDAHLGNLHAGSVDVTLGKVDLLSRNIGTVSGRLSKVLVAAPNGDPVPIDHVTLGGAATSTTAQATMSTATAQALAQSQLKAATGIDAKVVLKAPDIATVTAGGSSTTGRLVAANGALVLVPNNSSLPTVTLVSPSSGNPFHVTAVSIVAPNLTLTGTLDTQALLTN
jgi:hypothetical protein